jgi:hypothetical protein
VLILGSVYLAGQFNDSAQQGVCEHFMALKNAGDPKAEALLPPRPAVPEMPVSPEEADRLDADIMLHQPFRVRDVYSVGSWWRGTRQFVLVTEGALSSERIRVRTPTGIDENQRSVFSPDLVVEVRDGKLYGVRARLHEEPETLPRDHRVWDALRGMP